MPDQPVLDRGDAVTTPGVGSDELRGHVDEATVGGVEDAGDVGNLCLETAYGSLAALPLHQLRHTHNRTSVRRQFFEDPPLLWTTSTGQRSRRAAANCGHAWRPSAESA